MSGLGELPEPASPEGRAGLAAILDDPGRALVALDFDGTLSPIVSEPGRGPGPPGGRAGAAPGGRRGRHPGRDHRPPGRGSPPSWAGSAAVPGLIVLGHYGLERWSDGTLDSPAAEPGVAAARAELPGLLAAGAPDGTRAEYKGHAVAVHTRQAADPQAALDRLRAPLTDLAARHRADRGAGPDGDRAAPARHG